jgi:hypothetical protein
LPPGSRPGTNITRNSAVRRAASRSLTRVSCPPASRRASRHRRGEGMAGKQQDRRSLPGRSRAYPCGPASARVGVVDTREEQEASLSDHIPPGTLIRPVETLDGVQCGSDATSSRRPPLEGLLALQRLDVSPDGRGDSIYDGGVELGAGAPAEFGECVLGGARVAVWAC